MLPAIVRLFRMRWVSFLAYFPSLWDRLLQLASFSGTQTSTFQDQSNDAKNKVQAPDLSNSATDTSAASLGSNQIPVLTEDQSIQARREFIESLDLSAICALASKYNSNKSCRVVNKASGSFNVCFFVEFVTDEPKWVVRVPIEPAVNNPWDKLLSEMTTIQYLEHHTQIPLPCVRAYGRGAILTKSGIGTQMFLITDFIEGHSLDRKRLLVAKEEHRRNFYSQLIDILTELHGLRFPWIGSLMPNPDDPSRPIIGPVMSMSANTLRLPPPSMFSSAMAYMKYQFSLVSGFFSPPVRDHTIEDIRHEIFALHALERIFEQLVDPQLDHGPFILNHQDLRSPNIIVDDDLNIQGIIDWEFSSTVPRQTFTPPSWITGHDSPETDTQIHAEFCSVLNEKGTTNELCNQLKREWYTSEDTDIKFCVAHILRRPTDATDIFYDFLCYKVIRHLSEDNLDDVVSEFFDEHPELTLHAQRQAQRCERYTQYLKENGLYETEIDKILAESKALKAKYDWQ
ncbi:phosphotransferase enzyme family protein [Fusarium bulbicola]|nr:phosphotransferase enzyme family protein [Fusarium bulbicola]